VGTSAVVPERVLALLRALQRSGGLEGFYLAGGTGLALFLGHRVSEDLDFFHPHGFDAEKVLDALAREGLPLVVGYRDQGTLRLAVGLEGIKVELFRCRYPLIRPLRAWEGVPVADPVDVGLMQLAAIAARGSRKDFLDLYCICTTEISLRDLFRLVPSSLRIGFPIPTIWFLTSPFSAMPNPTRHCGGSAERIGPRCALGSSRTPTSFSKKSRQGRIFGLRGEPAPGAAVVRTERGEGKLEAEIRETVARFPVSCAYLFGSRARGASHARSDVDVAVLFMGGMAPEDRLDARIDIALALERALGLPVDVVDLESAPWQLWHRVRSEGRMIVEVDRARRVGFEVWANRVHEYARLDDAAVFGAMQRRLDDLRAFAAGVAGLVEDACGTREGPAL
jgi:predicted nucleotidyltransferase